METENANPAPEPRVATLDDLHLLCRSLNEAGAQYIVIGRRAIAEYTNNLLYIITGSVKYFTVRHNEHVLLENNV